MKKCFSSSVWFIQEILLIMLLIIGFTSASFAQLTGVKTIPGTYATLAAAIADLNSQGVGSGGVTFNIAAGYTETLSSLSAGLITATGTSANPIVFQKSGGGADPLITAYSPGTSTLYDGIITIAGGDYITFNGIDLQENSSNTTGTTRMEWGYGLVKKNSTSPFDGCQYVAIENCTITLSNADTLSAGIYAADQTTSDTTSLVITASSDALNNCTFTGNTIQNAFNGIVLKGYYGAASPGTLYDQNNTITNNTIQNYGISSGIYRPAYGMYLNYENAAVITGNTINNAAGGGSSHGNALYGIYVNSLNMPINGSLIIRNNTFTLNRGSNALTSYGIYNSIYNCDVVVSNNTFQNWVVGGGSGAVYCYYQGAQNNSISLDSNHVINNTSLNTTGNVYGIYNSSKTQIVNIRKDTIMNFVRTGVSGFMYAMNNGGSAQGGSAVITDNYIYNINNNSNNSSGLYGIIHSANNLQSLILSGNTVDSLVVGAATTYGINFQFNNPANVYSNTVSRIYSGSTIYGIYGTSLNAASANTSIYSNNISALTSSGNTSIVYGMRIEPSGSGSQTKIYKNKIYNILESGAGTTPKVYGIYVTTSGVVTLSSYVYNNFVSDLRAPNATGAANIYGLYLIGSAATHYQGAYYNTIYMNAVGSSAAFTTAGIYASTSPVVDLRNNIVVNTSYSSNGSPTGYHAVFQTSSSTLTNYSSVSNNNDFYKGATAQNVIYYDGTTAYSTLAAYQTLVSPRDAATFSANPVFINSTTTPYNLHINPAVATQINNGGTPVSSPYAVTDDIDGDTRNATTPDVGADEFNGFFTLNLTALIEAMWVAGGGTAMTMAPSVTVELHDGTTKALVESKTATLTTAGIGTFNFTTAVNGTPYYIVVKSLNTVETWSAAAQSFTSGSLTYDFTTGLVKAYTDGSNPPLALHSGKYCIYSGDVNQDGYVTGDDYTGVDNDNTNFGYHVANDVNGDGYVTGDDYTFIDNNNALFVQRQVPPGAPGFVAKRVIKSQVHQKSSVK